MQLLNKSNVLKITLWLILSLILMLNFFLMLSVGVIAKPLSISLQLNALELSLLSSSYLYIYILLQMPAGILLDSYDVKNFIVYGTLICGLGCFIFANSETLLPSMLGRCLSGTGLSCIFLSTVLLGKRWFQKKYFGIVLGIADASGMIGAIICNILLSHSVDTHGWRSIFMIAGVCSIFLSVTSYIIFKSYYRFSSAPQQVKVSINRLKDSLARIKKEKKLWLNSVYVFIMYIPITVFAGLWAIPFFTATYNISLEQATFASCLVLLGTAVGSPFAGKIFNNTEKRLKAMQIFPLIVSTLLATSIYIYTTNYYVLCLLMFMLGLSCCSIIQSYALISELSHPESINTNIGFTNTLSLASAVVFQPLVGILLDIYADDWSVPYRYFEYSREDYQQALCVLPIMIFIACGIARVIARNFTNKINIQ